MTKLIKPFFNKYYFIISYLLIILVNFQILNNEGFSDDFTFLSSGSHIARAPNPFYYFFPWSIYFKSWSFSYLTLWIMFKLFATDFLYYRILNISVHYLNHTILRNILKKQFTLSDTKLNIYSLIFLLHPLSVLTTSWVFQLKTLLGVFFMLIFLNKILSGKFNEKKEIVICSLIFWLSIVSKISAVLLPIPVYFLVKKRFTTKKAVLITTPLLIISLFYGLLNIKGMTTVHSEVDQMQSSISHNSIKRKLTKGDAIRMDENHEKGEKTGFNFDINIYNEVTTGANSYIAPIFNLDNFIVKYVVSIQNLGRFVLSSIGLNNYLPFYEDNIETATSPITYVYFCFGLGLLLYFLKNSNVYLYLTAAIFIPISGIFYIPYMKFSYTSDHWFYPAFCMLFVFLIKSIKDKPKVAKLFGTIIIASYTLTIYKYKSFPELLNTNYSFYKNPIITKNISNYYELNGDINSVIIAYSELIDKYDHDDFNSHKILVKSAYSVGDIYTVRKHYPQSMVNILDRKDTSSMEMTNRYFKDFILERDFILAPSLNAINSHNMSEQQYQKTMQNL